MNIPCSEAVGSMRSLYPTEITEGRIIFQQLFISGHALYCTIFHVDHLIIARKQSGIQGMGDGDHSQVLLRQQRIFNLYGSFGIQSRSSFVQNDDFGIPDEGSGQGDSLTLAAGKAIAVFADLAVQAIFQLGQKLTDTAGR